MSPSRSASTSTDAATLEPAGASAQLPRDQEDFSDAGTAFDARLTAPQRRKTDRRRAIA